MTGREKMTRERCGGRYCEVASDGAKLCPFFFLQYHALQASSLVQV